MDDRTKQKVMTVGGQFVKSDTLNQPIEEACRAEERKRRKEMSSFLSVAALAGGFSPHILDQSPKPKMNIKYEPKPKGWNRPCKCGSGKKFKMCCGRMKDE